MKTLPRILKESANGYQTFTTDDELFSKRIIFFTDDVTSESCQNLIKSLMYLESQNNDEITIYINSPGGEVNSGLAVYDYIRLMKSPVRTVCIGTAASMGSILFLAGQKREMFQHTRLMIHDPSYNGGSLAGMKPLQIQSLLEDIIKVRNINATIIAERTGLPIDTIYKMTEKDTYLNADQAFKMGFATKIIYTTADLD